MAFVVLVLVVFVVWLWTEVSRLSQRLETVDRRLLDVMDTIQALQPAERRVSVPAPAAAPAPIAPERPVAPAAPVAHAEPEQPASVAAPESWEITVGTSWLNKIGVLTLVIGVALLVAYSFPLMGPAGRIAIGYALSGAILGVGVWLERRDMFRNYAYGLIAGGWAGVYFTTFAMHDVPAAKIVHSDLVAVTLLLMVAAGMIAHSLRYRSQIVTSLTFVVAYSTLALSPLSGFSLAASVPLATAVLMVSQRLGWPGISALGITATYGAFILRSELFPGGAMDPSSALPYATLAVYWLTFETADLIGLRLRRLDNPAASPFQASVSMLALNAAGFLGSIVVISPETHPELRSTLMFGTGAAYIVSAIVRAWLLPERRALPEQDRPFDVSHAATAMAALLFAAGIVLRFKGVHIPLGWLLVTQLLFVSGLTLSDRWLRRMASIVAAPVTMAIALSVAGRGRSGGLGTEAVATILIALIWYANRESIRIKGRAATWFEPAYTWAATALLGLTAGLLLEPAHFGLASWILTLVLLEVGLRRDHEYTRQSYVAGAVAGYATLLAFVTPAADGYLREWGAAPSAMDDWLVLPAAIAISALGAIRLLRATEPHSGPAAPLSRASGPRPVPVARGAAAVALALSAAMTMVFEWRVLPAEAVASAWALTALAFVAGGGWKQQLAPRMLGYAMAATAAVRQFLPMVFRDPNTNTEIVSGALVIAAIYVASYLGARAIRRDAPDANEATNATAGPERAVTVLLSVGATACLAIWKYRVLVESLVAPAYAITGLVLAALGAHRDRRGQRWQGYGMALVASASSLMDVLDAAPATSALVAGTVTVAVFVYATGLVTRRRSSESETLARTVVLVAGSVVLATTTLTQARPTLVTLLLALQGLAVMATGLLTRERVMRLSGLSVLLGCLLKVFFYDLRELDPLPRIFSFVVLGLVLLGISWVYTRYREQIRTLL